MDQTQAIEASQFEEIYTRINSLLPDALGMCKGAMESLVAA